ncbi:hypothetical protein BpHYR1_033387, partial [Brachionus plicatilis]
MKFGIRPIINCIDHPTPKLYWRKSQKKKSKNLAKDPFWTINKIKCIKLIKKQERTTTILICTKYTPFFLLTKNLSSMNPNFFEIIPTLFAEPNSLNQGYDPDPYRFICFIFFIRFIKQILHFSHQNLHFFGRKHFTKSN